MYIFIPIMYLEFGIFLNCFQALLLQSCILIFVNKAQANSGTRYYYHLCNDYERPDSHAKLFKF